MQGQHSPAASFRARTTEEDRHRTSSGTAEANVPGWVTRLSRPASASPRQEAFCLPYDARGLTRGNPCQPSKSKAAHQALASTQIAFPPELAGASFGTNKRSSRSAYSSDNSTPRPSGTPTWVDRLSSAARQNKDAARHSPPKTTRAAQAAAPPSRPATASSADARLSTSLRAKQQHWPYRSSSNASSAAWNLEAIRQQLARLQASNSSSPRQKLLIPDSPKSPDTSFKIPAFRQHSADVRQLERMLASSEHSNDENNSVPKQQLATQVKVRNVSHPHMNAKLSMH